MSSSKHKLKQRNIYAWLLISILINHIENSYGMIIASEKNESTLACSFYETINITSGHEQHDGSWYHNSISYPVGHFMSYNYIRQNESIIKVNPHVRGCYCLQQPCINACCETDKLINWANDNGDGSCTDVDDKYKTVMWEVGTDNPQNVDVLSAFHWKYSRPDGQLFFLNSELKSDQWQLMEVRIIIPQKLLRFTVNLQ